MTTRAKLYVYVDESGQDTSGRLFIVVAVISDAERNELLASLQKIETSSGKGHQRKWMKTREKERITYLEQALTKQHFSGTAYTQVFGAGTDYQVRMAIAIAQSIILFQSQHDLKRYEATVIIDGFSHTEARRMGTTLRKLGIHSRKVRGARDESNAALRFADALAGLTRATHEGNITMTTIQQQAQKIGLIVPL